MNRFTSMTVVQNLAMKSKKTGCTHSYSLSVGYTDRMGRWGSQTHMESTLTQQLFPQALTMNSKAKEKAGDLGQPCLVVQGHKTQSAPRALHSYNGKAISYCWSSKEYSCSGSPTKIHCCCGRGKSKSHLPLEQGRERPCFTTSLPANDKQVRHLALWEGQGKSSPGEGLKQKPPDPVSKAGTPIRPKILY